MTAWTWKISDARVINENDLNNVAKEIGYEVTRTQDGQTHTIAGRAALNGPDPANFKPFGVEASIKPLLFENAA